MTEITIIIPVHKIEDESIEKLFVRAYESIPEGLSVIIPCGKEAKEKIESLNITGADVEFIVCEDTSVQNLVNTAAQNVKTKYMSVLEYDDAYTEIWLPVLERYIKDFPTVDVFMPLTELYDYSKPGKFTEAAVGYANEPVWAAGFSEEIGFWDEESLKNYYSANFTGSVIRTSVFNSKNGLKKSLEYVYWYEFLLRLVTAGVSAYVIPKICYKHTVNREGCIVNEAAKTISQEKYNDLIDTAQKECMYNRDRNLK